jgi:hypothetical protein
MPDILDKLAQWGPGMVIAGLIVYLLYKLAHRLGSKFIETIDRLGSKFIVAQEKQAEALGHQAQSMEGLRTAITASVNRDDTAHREMLVLLKYIAQGHEEMMRIKREHDNCQKCGGDIEQART